MEHALLYADCVSDAAISHVLFDPFEELLWVATAGATVHAFALPAVEPHCTFRPHHAGIAALFPHAGGLVIATPDGVRYYSKGGFPRSAFASAETLGAAGGVRCGTWCGALLALAGGTLSLYDPATSQIVSHVLAPERPWAIARASDARGLLALASGADDVVSLYDARTLGLVGRLEHGAARRPRADGAGGLVCDVALASAGPDILAACELEPQRHGGAHGFLYEPRPSVALWDLRTLRRQPDVPFAPGALRVDFHRQAAETIAVASADGDFQLLDARGGQPAADTRSHCGCAPGARAAARAVRGTVAARQPACTLRAVASQRIPLAPDAPRLRPCRLATRSQVRSPR